MRKFTLLLVALLATISAFAADYYVAGSSSLCGSDWSNNDANNKMTLTNGVYVKSYANVPAGSHEFKITNGTWDNSKGAWCVDASTSTPGYTGSDNISFTLLNATNITISYNESTDKITLKAEGLDKFGEFTINSYTLCGDFPCFGGDWAPTNKANNMTKGNDGIWTKTYENITLEAKTYQYKVAANNNWGNGEFPTQGNNQYEIKEAGAYNITFTYNPAKPELTCNASLVGEATEKLFYPINETIYVTVHSQWTADNARFAAYFFGTNGNIWTNMTNIKDAVYSLTIPAGEWTGMIICRMNPNNTKNRWNNDGEENGPFWGAQTQDIKYEEGKNHYIINSEDQTWDGNKPGGYWTVYENNPGDDNNDPEKPQPEITSYTICGDFPFLDWNTANTANHMTKGDDGIWSKTYENQILEVKIYKYKIAANDNWGEGEYPTNNVNQEYTINETGSYTVTFTFNPSIPSLTCTATKVGENPDPNPNPDQPQGDTYYTLCGDFPFLDWEPSNTSNNMTKGTDGIWTKSYSNQALDTKTYQYKVAANGTWNDNQFPQGMVNQEYAINEAGTYNVTFSYNPSKPELICTATKVGDNGGGNGNNDPEKPQPEASVYTLCGDSIIFGNSWDETNTNNDMTKGSDGIWVKEYTEITLTKGSYEYKVVADHNWDTAGKYPSDDSNMTLYIAKDGVYDLKFTFDPTIPELKAFATNKVNVENVIINNIYAINGFIYAETDITIYTLTGQDVTSQNGNLQNGVYIIKTQNETSKLIINN